MSNVEKRIEEIIRQRNRELAVDAALKAVLGFVFTCFVSGFLFWFGWFLGFTVFRSLQLQPWQFGAIFAGLFLIVSIWSAWRRVNPLAGLKPLTKGQWLLTLASQASPDLLYFSPRHASAGMAMILLGGPARIFEALGMWRHRLPTDSVLIEEAAALLASCRNAMHAEQVKDPAAAQLLRRLGLVKVVPHGDSAGLEITDRGYSIQVKAKKDGKPV